jgi:ubiquinone/menaquinone biosynthesis C-methylase UbiE
MAKRTSLALTGQASGRGKSAWQLRMDIPIGTDSNIDLRVARGFGQEWSTFRQDEDHLSREQRQAIFNDYFGIFPWHLLPAGGGVGLDVGCGTGRWSVLVAPRVQHLHLLDASAQALSVAKQNLRNVNNVSFHLDSVASIPLPPKSLDFAFSLGVLHHVPDTEAAIVAIADKLKPNAPFLLYLYYALDNRPICYRLLWRITDLARLIVSRLPHPLRLVISQAVAALVYWPLARIAQYLSQRGRSMSALPLSYYADKSFYVMRTDAYDRFCTRLEKRFRRSEIERILKRTGFKDITFSDKQPFWCAVGIRAD